MRGGDGSSSGGGSGCARGGGGGGGGGGAGAYPVEEQAKMTVSRRASPTYPGAR
eukprot:COSAG01_NODE_51305_length_355_cov_12.281250_1_plen_53_part_10